VAASQVFASIEHDSLKSMKGTLEKRMEFCEQIELIMQTKWKTAKVRLFVYHFDSKCCFILPQIGACVWIDSYWLVFPAE
jgi:hypothetical protein